MSKLLYWICWSTCALADVLMCVIMALCIPLETYRNNYEEKRQ